MGRPAGPDELGALAELDAAVAAARSDALLAAGPFALAVLGWAMVRRKRRQLGEHLAAVDAIVAESRDVPPPGPSCPVAEDRQDGPSGQPGDELVDVDALAEMYGRGEPGV